jgi:hypothetical protein
MSTSRPPTRRTTRYATYERAYYAAQTPSTVTAAEYTRLSTNPGAIHLYLSLRSNSAAATKAAEVFRFSFARRELEFRHHHYYYDEDDEATYEPWPDDAREFDPERDEPLT